MRKAVNDEYAQDAALEILGAKIDPGFLTKDFDTSPNVIAEQAMRAFPVAEFETVTTKIAGEEVTMRRVVLTGDWNVVR